jgi:hypothetical protein
MKCIKRLFIADMEKQQQTKCNRKRQTHNINDAECAVPQEVSPPDFEIIFKHGLNRICLTKGCWMKANNMPEVNANDLQESTYTRIYKIVHL